MRPAAQYLRMSTEHQRYSLQHQAGAIAAYAAARGFEVVKTYKDAGRSGLRIKRRDALKALLADVLRGEAEFDTILVFDVSRWGRFQDTDESAHYEFICRSAGVQVRYCAEMFENDGSMTSTIIKNLKRVMAAEYSRDLSSRVSLGLRRAALEGRWRGGPAPYGLRRMLFDHDGRPLAQLELGEHKSIQAHKVFLVPGPPEEVAVVQRIFRLFVMSGLNMKSIARQLNAEEIPTRTGRPWTPWLVALLLRRETYAGNMVSCRSTTYLGAVERHPRDQWVRVDGVVPAIITQEMFDLAARNLREPRPSVPDDELLEPLRVLLRQRGRLTARAIKETLGLGRSQTYLRRFGRWSVAYQKIGYVQTPPLLHSKLRPFKPRLLEMMGQTDRRYGYISRLWRGIKAEGYSGGYESIREFVAAQEGREIS